VTDKFRQLQRAIIQWFWLIVLTRAVDKLFAVAYVYSPGGPDAAVRAVVFAVSHRDLIAACHDALEDRG
jgi:hypothetical protein